MIRVKEAILVEGRYDKSKLSALVDGLILEAGGFSLFRDKEKLRFLRGSGQGPGPDHPHRQRRGGVPHPGQALLPAAAGAPKARLHPRRVRQRAAQGPAFQRGEAGGGGHGPPHPAGRLRAGRGHPGGGPGPAPSERKCERATCTSWGSRASQTAKSAGKPCSGPWPCRSGSPPTGWSRLPAPCTAGRSSSGWQGSFSNKKRGTRDMELTREALRAVEFRSRGQWYQARQVDQFIEELTVAVDQAQRERDTPAPGAEGGPLPE